MDRAITIGEILWPLLIIAGALGVLGVFALILTIIASGYRH